jgi:lysophospholipase L1-like esterase
VLVLNDGQTLLLTGDSITDCGRSQPLGLRGKLGDGYVSILDSQLAANFPSKTIRVLNTGISGNRVTDLKLRWHDDVLNHKPDCLSIMIGINDVWRRFDTLGDSAPVTPKRFEKIYRELLEQSASQIPKIILMTPFLIEANPTDPMRQMMSQYGLIVQQLAKDFAAYFVDTQAAFDAYLKHQPATSLSDDRVHPNQIGHLILANAFLDLLS